MLTASEPELLNGIVEVNETYKGGKDANRRLHKKKGSAAKPMVVGAVQRAAM